jgi:hypothetical protein
MFWAYNGIMHYKVSLRGDDKADRLWLASHVDMFKDKGEFMFVATKEEPARFTEELSRTGASATFTPVSKSDFDTQMGFVS